MEGGYGNRGSSFSQSRRGRGRGRGQRFPSNQSKVSSFAGRGTPSSSSANRASASVISNTQEDDAQPSSNFVGTCPYMCPERERIQREKLRDLAIFERLHGNPGKSSPALAVKKFCRTISTKYVQASDMRPITVLEDTLNYLLSLLESKEHLFEVVHDFVFDRTRSIRQDITMQNIVNKKAIYMYEGMVKFHVVSHYKLWCSMSDPNTASLHHLNMEQLTKTLASLFNLYEANQNSNHVHENEAEFHSLYVLLHLGSYSQPMVNLYIIGVRVLALSCINFGGYKLHPYPLLDLSKLLFIKLLEIRNSMERIDGIKQFHGHWMRKQGVKLKDEDTHDNEHVVHDGESDLESFCNHCGLETGTDESGNKLLPTKQTTFSHPKGGFQRYSFLGLQEYER
ncbi:hypothetical protein JHK82_036698 [Glycine max]|nr:hypothetical protein JHK82_036698 [Glycine max]